MYECRCKYSLNTDRYRYTFIMYNIYIHRGDGAAASVVAMLGGGDRELEDKALVALMALLQVSSRP